MRLAKPHWHARRVRGIDCLSISSWSGNANEAIRRRHAICIADRQYVRRQARPARRCGGILPSGPVAQRAGHELDATDLPQRIERCEQASVAVPTRCWTVLSRIAESISRAERTAAQVALAIDFNLWRFEPRSFGAWYERAFPGAIPYPHEANTDTPIWRFALVYQLLALGRAAQDMHDHPESLLVLRMADEAAKVAESPRVHISPTGTWRHYTTYSATRGRPRPNAMPQIRSVRRSTSRRARPASPTEPRPTRRSRRGNSPASDSQWRPMTWPTSRCVTPSSRGEREPRIQDGRARRRAEK